MATRKRHATMDFQVESPMDKPKDVVVILFCILMGNLPSLPLAHCKENICIITHGLVVDVVGVSGLICNTIYAAGKNSDATAHIESCESTFLCCLRERLTTFVHLHHMIVSQLLRDGIQ